MGAISKLVGPLEGILFGGKSDAPAASTPAVTPPPPMPTPDDKAVKDAQKRSALRARRRSGRQSTILSDPNETETLG